jgi:hypothetical protein
MIWPPGIGRLLRWLFPWQGDPKFAGHSPDDLRRRYRKWDLASRAAFLLLAPLCTYVLHEAFVAYTQNRPREPSVYELRPGTIFWYVPAVFLGCVVAGFAVRLVYRALLRGRSGEYRYYLNVNAGINASRLYPAVGLLVGAPSLALAYFASQSTLRMTEHDLVIRRIWSLAEERHAYTDITALKEIHERRKDRRIFVIRFADAEDWTTKIEVIFPGDAEKAYLSRRSGRVIETLEAD